MKDKLHHQSAQTKNDHYSKHWKNWAVDIPFFCIVQILYAYTMAIVSKISYSRLSPKGFVRHLNLSSFCVAFSEVYKKSDFVDEFSLSKITCPYPLVKIFHKIDQFREIFFP